MGLSWFVEKKRGSFWDGEGIFSFGERERERERERNGVGVGVSSCLEKN